MSPETKIVLGSLLLTVCGGVFGAAIVDELRWRMRERRRRLRRGRVGDVDLTGAKPS